MQGITGVCKDLQRYPKDYRGIRITGVYKGLHGFTRVYKGLLWITRVYKGFQGIAWVYKGNSRV